MEWVYSWLLVAILLFPFFGEGWDGATAGIKVDEKSVSGESPVDFKKMAVEHALLAPGEQEVTDRPVIASEARQSMSALFARWIAALRSR